jgi:hypothetical protein
MRKIGLAPLSRYPLGETGDVDMRPERLYKYQTVSARTLENLKLRTLWFSSPSCFNDPFDCALHIVHTALSDADLDRAYRYLLSRGDTPRDLDMQMTPDGKPGERLRQAIVQGANLAFEELRSERLGKIGIACFSAKNDDPLMWAHYADGHRGFCLEFDTSGPPFSKAEPVKYHAEVPPVNPLDYIEGLETGGPGPLDLMVRTKSECWQYEAEWRVLHAEAGTAYTYPPELLTGIYLGASMPTGHKDIIGQLLLGAPTQLHEMRRTDRRSVVPRRVTYTPYYPTA